MSKIVIFGNSGSGKSTLAKQLAVNEQLAHLDLDTVAWQSTMPPKRMSIEDSKQKIDSFINNNENWVIEGCYTDLLELVVNFASKVVFLNLPVSLCVANAKNRPWEPHKYESKEAQDANLDMLIDWIAQYEVRFDTFSKSSHQKLYDSFQGDKTMYTSNERE